MKPVQALLVVFLSVIFASGAAYYVSGTSLGKGANQSTKETRLEQVKRTGVLRCGYIVIPPFVTKDPNSGTMGGLIYDVVEELGRQLKLKVEWTAETSWGQMPADLSLNHYDIIAGPVFRNPNHAREADFTNPLLYSPVFVYVRKDDARFNDNVERVNRPDVSVVATGGQFIGLVAVEEFPKARIIFLPQLSTLTDQYMTVASGKADATTSSPHSFAKYNATNPGVLRPIAKKPLRLLAMGLPIPSGEPAFKATINTTLAYLHDSGFIDKTLKKYDDPVKFIRVAKPYVE